MFLYGILPLLAHSMYEVTEKSDIKTTSQKIA